MEPEALIVRGLRELGSTVQTTPPPIDQITTTDVLARRRHRKTRAAMAVAGTAIALAGGVAAAGDGFPTSIAGIFGQTRDNPDGLVALADRVALHATFTASDGISYEWWIAPTSGGGGCDTILAAGAPRPDDWFVACGSSGSTFVHPEFVNYASAGVGGAQAYYGTTPAGTTVTLLLEDGRSVSAPVTDHEFFVVVPGMACTTDTPCAIASATATDEAGNVVASGL